MVFNSPAMTDRPTPVIPKWPFFCADIILAATAAFIVYFSEHPMELSSLSLCFLSVFSGACLSVIPYLLEYRAANHAFQNDKLQSATDQLHNLELLNVQVGTSVAQLHVVLEECAKLVSTSGSLSDHITAEAKLIREQTDQSHETERSTLRLEIEKLRRSEHDWLQVLTGIMDHVYALHQAALRSGQPELSRQIGLFQRACRDLARRVGLVPFAPEENQPFDPNLHHLADANTQPPPNALISRIIAAGYTYQGQLIRRALISCGSQIPASSDAETMPASSTASTAEYTGEAVPCNPSVPQETSLAESGTPSDSVISTSQPSIQTQDESPGEPAS